MRLEVTGEQQTVFKWETQRCDTLHVPDSPARALRLTAGGVALVAAHFTNVVLLGDDLGSLAPSCATSSRGAEDPNPEAFNDRFWVQALAPLPDGRVLGLASHEYMGKRHPGRCGVTEGPGYARCWYSAITATVAEPGSWRFRPLPLPERVVAASPAPYDPTTPRRTGFFSVTNIVFDGGFAYLMVYTEGVPNQPRGMCLLRAPRDDLVSGWRALAGGSFRARLNGAGSEAEPCDIVGKNAFPMAVRSVVRLGSSGPWVAVFAGRSRDAISGGMHEGIFYSTSPDLRAWSAPALLLAVPTSAGRAKNGLYFQYPSLIDHESPSSVFDVAEGHRLHLYLTRLDLTQRRHRTMNRDLIRLPIAVVR